MTNCKTCRFWQADPNDNGMGTCTGIIASGRVEINSGSYGASEVDILTPAEWSCADGKEKDK